MATRWGSLGDLKLSKAAELLEDTQNCLDDIWKADSVQGDECYSQRRMEHLFGVLSNSVARYVQRVLAKLDLWHGPWLKVRAALREGSRVCKKWVDATKQLTRDFWPGYREHPWETTKDGRKIPPYATPISPDLLDA